MKFPVGKFLAITITSLLLFSAPQIVNLFIAPISVSEVSAAETSSLVEVRASYNLKDELNNRWQVILLKEIHADAIAIHLRLVGFPLLEFDHSQPLQIADPQENSWTVVDLYEPETSAFNVAEYNLREIIPQLPHNETLNLSFYLTENRQVNLKISSEVVRQWQKIAHFNIANNRQHLFSPLVFIAKTAKYFPQIVI